MATHDRDPEKQSSVLFSLQELMSLEEDRVHQEQSKEEQARRESQQAKMRAELQMRVSEEARLRAEAERRAIAAQQEREQAARLEAIHLGELERARMQAEAEARRRELELAHEHQRQVLAIRSDGEQRRLRRTLVAVTTLVLTGATAAGLYYGLVLVPGHRQQSARAEQDVLSAQRAREAAERERATVAGRISELEQQIAGETDENKKLKLQLDLLQLRPPSAAPPQGKLPPPRTPPPEKKPDAPCNRLDPADPCL